MTVANMAKNMISPDLATTDRLLRVANYVYLTAACFSAIAAIALFGFSRHYTILKDHELEQYKQDAKIQIEDARAKAAGAKSASDQAIANATQARADAEQARADAQHAKTQQEELRKERVQLEIRLKQLEKENATAVAAATDAQAESRALEDAAAPRDFSFAQTMAFVSVLKPFHDDSVTIGLVSGDYETNEYANKIADAFRDAGLNPSVTSMLGMTGFGIEIVAHDAHVHPQLVRAIAAAFTKAGIHMSPRYDTSIVGPGQFIVFVGSKNAAAR